MPYRCACCGELHDDLPDLGFGLPDAIHELTEVERAERARISDDLCVLDGEHFFVRGVIEIPLLDDPGYFGLGVWVTQSADHFAHYRAHFRDEHPDFGPFFGWLANDVTSYDVSTLHLKTMVHFRSGNERPRVEVEPTDHPLAVDQHDGISLARAWALVHQYLG